MTRTDIPAEKFVFPVSRVWDRQWLLLAAGDFEKQDYNCMTVGWGSFGVMWGKPSVMVAVRPTRYTWQFMEKYDSFTLCAFPEDHHPTLSYIGSHSGRDEDKVKATGLTPMRSRMVRAPVFDEAELAVECRKIYFDDLDPAHFLDPSLENNYLSKDYHRMYFGEIVAVAGAAAWALKP
jgi:flavin reductase (DIM6/NTAB) family NADH-FMN oxidoreductase RutF